MSVTAEPRLHDAARTALARATDHLLSLQHPDGWWKGELETNVTMDAEDLLFREFLGIRTAEQTEQSATYIRSKQLDDGTWAVFHGGPAELSTTIEAYVALRLVVGDRVGQASADARGRLEPAGPPPAVQVQARVGRAADDGRRVWYDLAVRDDANPDQPQVRCFSW